MFGFRTKIHKKSIYLFLLILLSLFNIFPLWGQINFSSPDVSDDSRLLYRMNFKGSLPQDALFVSYLGERSARQLTAFPERMDLLDNNRTLQIRNAAGVVRIPARGGLPQGGFNLFAETAPKGIVEETAVSPNGRWILRMAPETHAYGSLVLEDALSGDSIVISSGVEMPGKFFPASWSNDSRVFIYSKLGRLYYCTVNLNMFNSSAGSSDVSSAIIDERFRFIGEGTINSIAWDNQGDLYYLRSSSVFRIRTAELFARTFYTNILEIGSTAGRIPFGYNPYFDQFWIAPDADSLLLLKGGREVFYYPLNNDENNSIISGLPYMVLPGNCFNVRVLSPHTHGITILASIRQNGAVTTQAWRLNPGRETTSFASMNPPQAREASLSPDGSMVLFWGESGIYIYDYEGWKLLLTISTRPAYSCLWIGSNEIITGGAERIERVVLFPGDGARIISRELICLSRAGNFGFETGASPDNINAAPGILAQSSGTWYVTDGRSAWTEIANPRLRPASQISSQYRVFIEDQGLGPWENILMIRNIASVGTFPIFPVTGYELRSGPMEISLCFDLYDDAEGLPEVLEALDQRGIKATFFLGGEFIRSYPGASRDIAEAGHEAASLFFSAIDLSDPRYQIDNEFVLRGLARNEDEYFNATGRELALLWHPPWYNISASAHAAASAAGYTTVGRDADALDWVSHEDERSFGLPCYSAAGMIDRIMGMIEPGMVIPVRLGLNPGGRTEYLFQYINVLLDAIAREGYQVVPVSRLR